MARVVGIIGPSGSGKSTLMRRLLSFFDTTDAKVIQAPLYHTWFPKENVIVVGEYRDEETYPGTDQFQKTPTLFKDFTNLIDNAPQGATVLWEGMVFAEEALLRGLTLNHQVRLVELYYPHYMLRSVFEDRGGDVEGWMKKAYRDERICFDLMDKFHGHTLTQHDSIYTKVSMTRTIM
jgi:ABC-type dipeptide/oligopeptide/nickel transport system ATPase component